MSTKNLSQLKIFALSNETTKACWQLGSLSKFYKHFQLICGILLSAPSTASQSLSACMIARSSAYAYFLEMVAGRSEV